MAKIPLLYSKQDYPKICQWLKDRNMKEIPESLLSTTGIMVEDVAVGFLYLTNSSVGYIEHYITNPSASRKARFEALGKITDELTAISEKVGVTLLIAGTNFPSIERLALNKGFKMISRQSVLIRGINERSN